VGLPYETTKQYTALQQTILETMEGLLAELDQSCEGRNGQAKDRSGQLLKKHALIMKQLNARVDRIVQEITA
jgi:hypothetical protein